MSALWGEPTLQVAQRWAVSSRFPGLHGICSTSETPLHLRATPGLTLVLQISKWITGTRSVLTSAAEQTPTPTVSAPVGGHGARTAPPHQLPPASPQASGDCSSTSCTDGLASSGLTCHVNFCVRPLSLSVFEDHTLQPPSGPPFFLPNTVSLCGWTRRHLFFHQLVGI